jgi:hypothetical protein
MTKIKNLEKRIARLNKEYGSIGAYAEYGEVLLEILTLIKEKEKEYSRNETVRGMTNLSPGILGISLHYSNHIERDTLTNQEVEISNSDGDIIYLSTNYTSNRFTITSVFSRGYCERELPGGNYFVKATLFEDVEERRITVDGDTYLEIIFPFRHDEFE